LRDVGLLDRLLGRPGRETRESIARSDVAIRVARAELASGAPAVALAVCRLAIGQGAAEPELLRLAGEACLAQGDARSAELFARAAFAIDDPQRLFELGSHLLSEEAPDAAAAILGRALARAPLDAVIRSELALALARLGRPHDVVETLALHPCLGDDPGAMFQFAWCSLLAGDAGAAEGTRRELAAIGDETTAPLVARLDAALDRARVGHASSPPDARDWMFVEHGALLVDVAPAHGGRHQDLVVDDGWLARVIAGAAWAYREIDGEPLRFSAADNASRPLTESLATAAGGTVIDLGKGRPIGIVVARAAGDLQRLADRIDGPGVRTFAAVMDWSRTAPRVPGVIGAVARRLAWESSSPPRPVAAADTALASFVAARRALLAPDPARVGAAYVPDAPLP
jgi:hypothetical protein